MSIQKSWRIGILLIIWTLFVALMGAVNGPKSERVRGAFVIPPTATPEIVAVAPSTSVESPTPTATEVPAPTPVTETAPASPAGDAMAATTNVAASAPVSATGTVSDTAPAFADLPPISSVADPMVVLGEDMFQRKAGGVGCQMCHGKDARGLVGPNIVGKTEEAIRAQFEVNAQMQFIVLSDKEMTAVATYLQFLANPSAFPLKAGGATAENASAGSETSAPTLSDPLILEGQQLYEATAGGIGCQLCHGKDAAGGLAPEIVGRTADDIRYQFEHSSAERLIKITDQEIVVIAGYLQYLANPTAGSGASASASAEDTLSLSDPVVAQGEQLYQTGAGNVGCQLCHGEGAKGGVAPAIVGKTAEDIHYQFEHSTAEQFIKLTEQEIDAVALYLQYLATQP